ncbi:MAG: amidohydrolase family protein, partial [Dehalococcoidia bacterium]|nr:amidohydrolase family protein [Dehalococcoidia bacterium]
ISQDSPKIFRSMFVGERGVDWVYNLSGIINVEEASAMLDLLIKNGFIIDGTGNPGFYGSVGVEEDTVTIIRGSTEAVDATREIDATGRIVSPGFIDMHAHSGLVLLAEPHHEPKVRQGITTELIGVDGNSYAPFRSQEDFKRFVELNSGLDGNPPLPGNWSTVEQYLSMFDRKAAVNIAYILGNSPVRIDAIGWDSTPATPADIANMKAIIREAMEEGAVGLSTGLDYPPGNYADTDELVELSKQVADLGGIYHTHVRYKMGDMFIDPFQEAIDIGNRSGIPVHITHFYQRSPSTGGGAQLLQLIEDRAEAGQDITFDSYPYSLGSTRILIVFPDWIHEGTPEQMKVALASAEARERLRSEVVPRAPTWHDMWLTYFKRPENHKYEGRSVAEIAEMMGQHPVDALCDLLLAEDLQVCYVAEGLNAKTLPAFVTHPLSMVGSDAVLLGDFPSPRTYGCFPVILAEYVREERQISLPNAIRKMTSFPAQRLGLSDRGILRDGMKADITIFDANTVSAPATRTEPKQFPIGIEYVIVNGTPVIDGGSHTGQLPGRALRH